MGTMAQIMVAMRSAMGGGSCRPMPHGAVAHLVHHGLVHQHAAQNPRERLEVRLVGDEHHVVVVVVPVDDCDEQRMAAIMSGETGMTMRKNTPMSVQPSEQRRFSEAFGTE